MQLLQLPEAQALRALTVDGYVLFGTRMVRLFAYGFLSVVLVLYLAQLGLSEQGIGVLLTWTLIGDAVISFWIAALADRIGRRRMLIVGAGLMVLAGLVLALTRNLWLLTLAAIVGTLSPSGGEVGPFLSIEQAALSQTAPTRQRTQVFAWYNLIGSFATALGALSSGVLVDLLQWSGSSSLASYRSVVLGYALLGIGLAALFSRLSSAVEADAVRQDRSSMTDSAERRRFGLHRSRNVVMRLSALFMLDAFAGGLVVQSMIAYWFYVRFGVEPTVLGSIFFGANMLAGLSALAAARIAARFGLINTMVWTHIPSNVLLILVPLMPHVSLAIGVLLARFSISQMDVPTRQSYTMAVVDPDERSAAAGATTIARTAASAISPTITGVLFSAGWLSLPFVLAGCLKIVYDLALYRSFRALKPPEERPGD
ncbi:MAG TPA: MFS transporter [Herpetosiphonaceae bacterium]